MSSFLEFRGKGIWCADSSFQTWCALLAESLRGIANEPWAFVYADHLTSEAKSPFIGYLNFGLDNAIGDDDHRLNILVKATEIALLELVKTRELPLERHKSLPHGEGVVI